MQLSGIDTLFIKDGDDRGDLIRRCHSRSSKKFRMKESSMALPVSASYLFNRCNAELFVVIDEEYGYKSWLWFPCMSAQELELWWQQQDNIESFWGRLDDGTMGVSHAGWPGEFFQMDDADDLYELHSRLWETAQYKSHIDTNNVSSKENPDTFLKRSDGALFLHRGATFE